MHRYGRLLTSRANNSDKPTIFTQLLITQSTPRGVAVAKTLHRYQNIAVHFL